MWKPLSGPHGAQRQPSGRPPTVDAKQPEAQLAPEEAQQAWGTLLPQLLVLCAEVGPQRGEQQLPEQEESWGWTVVVSLQL